MPWPSCNYKFQSVQTPHVKKGTPCPFPDTHPDLWAVTNTFWVPSFLAVHEGWPRVSNGRLPAPSVTTSWTLPARAAPGLRSRGQRALPAHTPCAGRLLPENAGELGVGERGDGDSSSTSLGLRRLHPHPGGAGPWELQARWRHRAVRTRIGQRAPCAPSPTGRCGESLLRISGLCLGSPASPRRPEPRSGRREGSGAGITKQRARPGGDVPIKPTLSRRAAKGLRSAAFSLQRPQCHPKYFLVEGIVADHSWGN